jgi:hypothetical protein
MKTLFIVILAFSVAACSPAPMGPSVSAAEDAGVAAVVQEFGGRLKNVSLLAPDAAQQIETQYGEFTAADLLAVWMADPLQAPGRLTSSPWPERIEIDAINMVSAEVNHVIGRVIEITSAEVDTDNEAASYAVSLTLTKTKGAWLISDYQIIGGP